MSFDKSHYTPLNTVSDDNSLSPVTDATIPTSLPGHHDFLFPPTYFWAGIIAFSLALFNVTLLPLSLSLLSSLPSSFQTLPTIYPNVNSRMDEGLTADMLNSAGNTLPWAYANGTHIQMTYRPPAVVARVNRVHPAETSNDYVEMVLSHDDSIILQFLDLDRTKHTCAVAAFRPPSSQLLNNTNTSLDLQGNIEVIEVWNISTKRVLDPTTVSYLHRPPRRTYLGSMDFRRSPNSTSRTFTCPESRMQTIELRCQAWNCAVQFRQLHTEPKLGFELVQWRDESQLE